MSSSDHWIQGEDIPILSYYFPEIMAALKIVVTEQFFHMSIEVAMPWMLWARTLSSQQEEAWADLMVSQRKKEIAALDIGLEGHLIARKRTHDGSKALNTEFPWSTVGICICLGNKLRKIRDQQILSLPARLVKECLDLSYPLCCSKSKQKKGLPSQVSGGQEPQRFKGSLGRSKILGTPQWLGRAGSDNKPQHLVFAEVQPSDYQNTVKHGLVALDSRGDKITNLAQINKKICDFLDRGFKKAEGLLSCTKNCATLEQKPLYLKYRLTVSTLSAEARGDRSGTCGCGAESRGPSAAEGIGVALVMPQTATTPGPDDCWGPRGWDGHLPSTVCPTAGSAESAQGAFSSSILALDE
ncbi:hypothetical protein E2C01_018013 [Portunus trituberculatus]|uniref:Uncharacterized protein n=1 Tax=Portunus trituberculatus TaxID=210409 RepID=A0A5B7DV29_PORTR|nr:hypothetical protein [Portunus trituberculatus]